MSLSLPTKLVRQARCLREHSTTIRRRPLIQQSSFTCNARFRYREGKPDDELRNPLDTIAAHRLHVQRRNYYIRRAYFAAGGLAFSMIGTGVVIFILDGAIHADQTEAPPGSQFTTSELKPEIESTDLVETGATAVPFSQRQSSFPRKHLPPLQHYQSGLEMQMRSTTCLGLESALSRFFRSRST